MLELSKLAKPDSPREKLVRLGAKALSDQDLLAIILGTGNRQVGVKLLAKQVLEAIDRKNDKLEIADLLKINGIGAAKACKIFASWELTRRRIEPRSNRIKSAGDVYSLLRPWVDKRQEHFLSISLNGAHEVIAVRVVTIGIVNAAQVHPREVFSDPIVDRACAVIVAHNHPSGDLTPSPEDLKVTRRLIDSGATLGISVLDHLIISNRGYNSFQENSWKLL